MKKPENFIKRPVNDRLCLAYEVCFQRDDISPHIWSRENNDEFGQLFCETDLSDEQWEFYTKLAKGEYQRVLSAFPSDPVFYESMVGDSAEYHLDMQMEIERRLGADSAAIIDDVSPSPLTLED